MEPQGHTPWLIALLSELREGGQCGSSVRGWNRRPQALFCIQCLWTPPIPPTPTLTVQYHLRCVVPMRPPRIRDGAGPLHLQRVCFRVPFQVHCRESSPPGCLLGNINWREKNPLCLLFLIKLAIKCWCSSI